MSFRYQSVKTIHLVTDVHQKLGCASIKLVLLNEKDGIKRNSGDAGVCVINEKNTKAEVSRDWLREMVFLGGGYAVPSEDKIDVVLR